MILNNFDKQLKIQKSLCNTTEKYIIKTWNSGTEQRYFQYRKTIIKELILKNN